MIGYDFGPPPLPKVMNGIKVVLKLAKQLDVDVPTLHLQSSKESAMRAAEGMRKDQFGWICGLETADELLEVVYEYLVVLRLFRHALAKDELTTRIELQIQEAISRMASAYYKGLLEVEMRGEDPLRDVNSTKGLTEALTKLVLSVMKDTFTNDPTIEFEVIRTIGRGHFVLEETYLPSLRKKQVQTPHHKMYMEAMTAIAPTLPGDTIQALADKVRDQMKDLLHSEHTWLFLVDEAAGTLWNQEQGDSRDNTVLLAAAGIAGSSALMKTIQNIDDPRNDLRFMRPVDGLGANPTESCIAVPLVIPDMPGAHASGEVVGVIYSTNKLYFGKPVPFSEEDEAFCEMMAPVLAQAVFRTTGAEEKWAEKARLERQVIVTNMIASAQSCSTVEELASTVTSVIFNEIGNCQAVSLFVQDYVNEKIWRAGVAIEGREASSPVSPAGDARGTAWDLGIGIVGKSIELGHHLSTPFASTCEFFDADIDSIETGSQWRIPGAIMAYPFKSVEALEEIRGEEETVKATRKRLREEKAFEEQLTSKNNNRRDPARKAQAEVVAKLEKEVEDAERAISRLTRKGTLGTIELIREQGEAPFTEENRKLLKAIEFVVSGVVMSVTAKGESQEAAEQALVLANNCYSLATNLEARVPIETLVSQLRSIMGVEEAAIITVDPSKPKELQRITLTPKGLVRDCITLEVDGQERKKSVLLQCFKSGVTLNLEDAEGCVLYNHKVDRIHGSQKTKSLLCIAQKESDGKITAVLQVVNKNSGRLFLSADERCIELFGKIAQQGITNAQGLREVSLENSRGLNVLGSMKNLSGNLSMKQLLHDIMQVVKKMMNCDSVHIFMVKPISHTKREIRFASTTEKVALKHVTKLTVGKSATKWTKRTIDCSGEKSWGISGQCCVYGEVIRLEGKKVKEDPRYCNIVDSVVGFEPSGLITCPIPDPSESDPECMGLGTIHVVNDINSRRPFTDQDAQTLESFMQLIAVTLKNAEQNETTMADTLSVKEMCDKLDDSRSMFSELGTKGMLRTVCSHIKEKVGARQVTIYGVNEKTLGGDREAIGFDRIAMDAEMLEVEDNKLPSASCKWGKNFVGHCVMERCVVNFEDILEDDRMDDEMDIPRDESMPSSVMCCPIWSREEPLLQKKREVIGVIHCVHISEGERHDRFSDYDMDLGHRIGHMVGICFENCSKGTLWRDTVEFSKLALDVHPKLTIAIGQQAMEKFPLAIIKECTTMFKATQVTYFVYDDVKSVLFRYAVDPAKPAKLDATKAFPLWGLTGETVSEKKSMVVPDLKEYCRKGQPVFDQEVDAPLALGKFVSAICCPIRRPDGKDTIAGAIMVWFDEDADRERQPTGLTEADIHGLELISCHVTSVLYCQSKEEKQAEKEGTAPKRHPLVPMGDVLDKMLQIADLDGSGDLNSEEEIFLMCQQLCMTYGIKRATRELVQEHVDFAWDFKKEWDVPEFVQWFENTMDEHYGTKKK